MACSSHTSCIQCVSGCKFWFVVLENSSQLCLRDPSIASAAINAVYNSSVDCAVSEELIETGSMLPIVLGVVAIVSVIAVLCWRKLDWIVNAINGITLRMTRRVRNGFHRRHSRIYDSGLDEDAIEMSPLPNSSRYCTDLSSEDGRKNQSTVLGCGDKSLKELPAWETIF